jgi:hypothetical protein
MMHHNMVGGDRSGTSHIYSTIYIYTIHICIIGVRGGQVQDRSRRTRCCTHTLSLLFSFLTLPPPPLPPSSLQAAFLGVLDGLAGVLVVRGERVRVGRGFASWGKEREFACGGARGLAREGRLCDTPCAPLRRRIHACGVACDSGRRTHVVAAHSRRQQRMFGMRLVSPRRARR